MNQEQGQPWWKFAHVWMVFAGPAVVVVASFITLYLAITIPDPVLTNDGPAQSSAPAIQARNHAATGVPPPAEP